jgi:Haem-binding domain
MRTRRRIFLVLAAVSAMLTPPILALTTAACGARQGSSGRPIRAVAQEYAAAVAPIFERKCADCHTGHPRYLWYHALPIVKTLIDRDIADARADMDLSRGFPPIGTGTPVEYLGAIRDVLDDHSMPPLRYRLMHPGSTLTGAERATILAWIDRGEIELSKPRPPLHSNSPA